MGPWSCLAEEWFGIPVPMQVMMLPSIESCICVCNAVFAFLCRGLLCVHPSAFALFTFLRDGPIYVSTYSTFHAMSYSFAPMFAPVVSEPGSSRTGSHRGRRYVHGRFEATGASTFSELNRERLALCGVGLFSELRAPSGRGTVGIDTARFVLTNEKCVEDERFDMQ